MIFFKLPHFIILTIRVMLHPSLHGYTHFKIIIFLPFFGLIIIFLPLAFAPSSIVDLTLLLVFNF